MRALSRRAVRQLQQHPLAVQAGAEVARILNVFLSD